MSVTFGKDPILYRRCRICERANQKFTPVNKQKCIQNWGIDHSSKSMEATAIFHMAINSVPDRQFVMKTIISDNNSTMSAHLHHKQPDHKNHKGKLPH